MNVPIVENLLTRSGFRAITMNRMIQTRESVLNAVNHSGTMTEEKTESYCMKCGETWDDHYDAVAHAYNKHDEHYPESIVSHRTVKPGEKHIDDFRAILEGHDGSVSLDHFVSHTAVQDREEAKTVLRTMIERGMVSTTPDWEYRLATNP